MLIVQCLKKQTKFKKEGFPWLFYCGDLRNIVFKQHFNMLNAIFNIYFTGLHKP